MWTPNTIKTISFDMDGKLWDFDSVIRRSLGEVLEDLDRLDPGAATMLSVDRMIAIRDRVHDDLKGRVLDLEDIRRESFKGILEYAGRTDEALAARLTEVYFEHRSANMALFDDVRPVLEALAPRCTLGIVSNGNSYPEHFGLEDLMAFSVYSPDHGGIEKPVAGPSSSGTRRSPSTPAHRSARPSGRCGPTARAGSNAWRARR